MLRLRLVRQPVAGHSASHGENPRGDGGQANRLNQMVEGDLELEPQDRNVAVEIHRLCVPVGMHFYLVEEDLRGVAFVADFEVVLAENPVNFVSGLRLHSALVLDAMRCCSEKKIRIFFEGILKIKII